MRKSLTDPQEISDVEAFLSSFDAFARAVRRARGARAGGETGALTLSQYGLLEPLIDDDTARVRDLATQAGVTAPTATRILDTLERRGFVRRTQAREDRRGVSIELTEMGRRVLNAQHDWLRQRQRSFYASLPAHERSLAPELLVLLTALIDELAAGPDQ
jgi:DNA-binding MarR family transcriptional regulator